VSENLLHRCALCGAVVAPESARLVSTCGGHLESDADRWNTPFRIRGARPEDDEVLRRIARGYWGREEVLAFGRVFSLPEERSLVADAGGAVAGFVSHRTEGSDGLLLALAVPPLYQGLGVGSSLLSAAIHALEKAGATTVRLTTTNDNLPALALFQRRGFEIEDVVPGVIARHLEERPGQVPVGFAGIPVRDEIRLQRCLESGTGRDAG